MLFTLEALPAKHGDSLLLHYGPRDDPELILIDGGPGGVYRRTLRPRLQEIRNRRSADGDGPLDIRLAMVSHIDDDHINGLLDLTDELVEQQELGRSLPFRIRTLWHNSFDDIVGSGAEEMRAAVGTETTAAGTASGTLVPQDASVRDRVRHPGAALLASVPQGRDLRGNTDKLGIPRNAPIGRILTGPSGGEPRKVSLSHGLTFRVLCPPRHRVEELQRTWDRELEERGLADLGARASAYVDDSVFNLASLVVLAEMDGRTMLLTGDARGDDILEGLENAGLLGNGGFHVDILKIPHHGSDRNVETDFFRAVTADHYVVSGDGRHGNPEPAMFEMLFAARPGASLTVHQTYPLEDLDDDYPVDRLRRIVEGATGEVGVRFGTPAEAGGSLRIPLAEPLPEG